jgi:hypothetical protein
VPSSVPATNMPSSPPQHPLIESSPSSVRLSERITPRHKEAVMPINNSLSKSLTTSIVSFDQGFSTEISIADRFEF